MMKDIRINNIFLNNYYIIKDYIFNGFIDLIKNKIFQISDNKSLNDEILYLIRSNDGLYFSYQSENYIKTNTQIIDLMNLYSQFITKNTALIINEGKNLNDNFILNTFIKNDAFLLGESSLEKRENKFIGKITFNDKVVNAVSLLYDNYHYLFPDIFSYNIGIVITDHEKEGIKEYTDKVIDALPFSYFKADFNLELKKQYSMVEDEFVNYIIVFNYSLVKKKQCKIKDVFTNEFFIIGVNEIIEFINDKKAEDFNNIKNILFKENFNIIKTKSIELCSACLKKQRDNVFLPLNQRLKEKKCIKCNHDSVSKVILY